MSVAIRTAKFVDVPAILALERQAAGAAHWTLDQYHKLVGDGVVLVAEEAWKFCGFICAQAVAGEWEIENVSAGAERGRVGGFARSA
jgi:hypothetical protein